MHLINPFNLPNNMNLIQSIKALGYEDREFKLITGDDLFLMQYLSPPKFGSEDIPGYCVDQIELPLATAKWLIDVIENKMWKSAAEGGLPQGAYSFKDIVAGENLALYREMNVGAKNQKGFRLTNFSRPSRIYSNINYQDFFITDLMLLEGGLLDTLKKI